MPAPEFNSIKVTTPRGTLSWPRLHEADTKFKAEGEYSAKLILSGAAAQELVTTIDQAIEDSYQAHKSEIVAAKSKEKNPTKRAAIPERAEPSYKELYENDQPTGEFSFNFKMKATGISKKTGKPWTRKPAVFTAKGIPMKAEDIAKVGGGSVARISGEISPFYTAALGAGVSLRLEAVQIIELKVFGDRSANAFGFGEEEGYDGSDDAAGDAGFKNEDNTVEPNNSGDF